MNSRPTGQTLWRSLRGSHPVLFCGVVALGLLACSASSNAMSSMGDATVSEVAGQPCFSLPSGVGPKMQLFGLFVTDMSLPPGAGQSWVDGNMWDIRIDYPGLRFKTGRASCIPYGSTLAGTHEARKPGSLQRSVVYNVSIAAKPLDGESPTVAYTAQFCIRPSANGSVEVWPIPRHAAAQRSTVEQACRP